MTDEGESLISVIIPTYYRNETLPQVIESCLASTYDDLEIIVVDDSGEEHAKPVATQYDIQYIAHEENKGGNPARNTGLAAARGDYIQLLDDDDVVHEEKFEEQVAQLQANENVGVSYCGIRFAGGGTNRPTKDTDDFLRCMLTFDWLPCTYSTMLTEAESLRRVAPLTARKCNDDVGTLLDLAQITDFDYVQRPLVEHCNSDRSRGAQPGCVDIRKRIFFEEYDHLYDEYPPHVRELGKKGLSYGYIYEANDIFEEEWFSWRAVESAVKALRTKRHLGSAVAVVSSLFGRPGWQVAKGGHWVQERLSST
jgi:glycosyltransferase involved in cell wall biosynthesis